MVTTEVEHAASRHPDKLPQQRQAHHMYNKRNRMPTMSRSQSQMRPHRALLQSMYPTTSRLLAGQRQRKPESREDASRTFDPSRDEKKENQASMKDLSCDLALGHRRAASVENESPTVSDLSIHGEHVLSTRLSRTDSTSLHEREEIKSHIEAYFRSASRSGMSLLHQPTTLANWSKGTIDQSLLEAIVLIGSYITVRDAGYDVKAAQARRCIQEVQDDVLRHIGKQTIAQLSLLVVLLRFRFDAGDFAEAWNLLAIASRLVFTMRLNHEHEGLDALTQETVRRLVWTVYDIDRKCCGGIDYLTVCPVDKMYIRLPCDDQSFEMGLRSTAPYLAHTTTSGPTSGLSAHSCKLKLLATRDRILRYTKRIRKSPSDASAGQAEMQTLQDELNTFEQSLPPEMRTTTSRLSLMVHSREGLRCIELHTMWLLSHCDLYRHCVPGIRESASREALARTPASFIDSCQRACLDSAVLLCDFWSQLHCSGCREILDGGMMAVAIYQVAQILHHLPHLLIAGDEVDVLRKKLVEALEVVTPKKATNWAKCLRDAERLVTALGEMHQQPTEASPSSLISDALSDTVDDAGSQQDHMQSRHHMLAYIVRDSRLSDCDTNEQSCRKDRLDIGLAPGLGGLEMPPPAAAAAAVTNLPSNALMSDMPSQMLLTDQDLDGFPPWDPFDMESNDYYDSNLDFLGASIPLGS